MPRTRFDDIDCSIARTMAILGQPWTPLILRDLFIGITRFDSIHAHIGVSRKVLSERLSFLVDEEVVIKELYGDRPARFDYRLTEQGWELCDILLAVTAWGDRWRTEAKGPPADLQHQRCGHLMHARIHCSSCNRPLHASDVTVTPHR